jgi:hypothetical protein
MSQPVGRGERDGFVRAGFDGGAASAVAARWVADEEAAAVVLHGLQAYLRYLPRDVALQHAVRDVGDARRQARVRRLLGIAADDAPSAATGAPADRWLWACWTLYGDPGLQTDAGRVRRTWRGLRTEISWWWWCSWHRRGRRTPP